MRRASSVLPFVSLAAALTGCGPKEPTLVERPAGLVSSSSVYLRNTFDTDPSGYLGRFVATGATDLDESNTMKLACSTHITWRFVDGGGVSYSENLNVSSEIGARLGIPVVAQAEGSHAQARTARAQYVLTGKMVADIPDPAAFAACCKSQPDQCSDRYVSEFIQGTGGLFHQASNSTAVSASGTAPQAGVTGGVDLARSAEWQRAAEFPNPVYFAFKLSPTPYTQGDVDACPAWVEAPPRAEDGVFVVGAADGAKSEQAARDAAMQSAQGAARTSTGIGGADLGGATLALRADEWCVRPQVTNKGTRYSARVLAFASNEAVATARVQAEAAAAARAEQARLAAEQERARLAAQAEADKLAAEQAAIARVEAERRAAEEAARLAAQAPPPPPPGPSLAPEQVPSPAPAVGPGPATGPASTAEHAARIRAAVQAESFSSDQLSALESSARGARLTAAEVREILDLLSFSGDQLSALKTLAPTVVDPANWQVIVDGFSFSTDRETARGLLPPR